MPPLNLINFECVSPLHLPFKRSSPPFFNEFHRAFIIRPPPPPPSTSHAKLCCERKVFATPPRGLSSVSSYGWHRGTFRSSFRNVCSTSRISLSCRVYVNFRENLMGSVSVQPQHSSSSSSSLSRRAKTKAESRKAFNVLRWAGGLFTFARHSMPSNFFQISLRRWNIKK